MNNTILHDDNTKKIRAVEVTVQVIFFFIIWISPEQKLSAVICLPVPPTYRIKLFCPIELNKARLIIINC